MPPPKPTGEPFVDRVYDTVYRWVQEEWILLEHLKQQNTPADSKPILQAMDDVRLSAANLARQMDNISEATLRRSLRTFGAPAPGEIIRVARIAYAKHLLTHTRLLVRRVASRCGYSDTEHFTTTFANAEGCRPSEYRRRKTSARTHKSKS